MPQGDGYGQGINLAINSDAPDAQQLVADLEKIIGLTVMVFNSAAHRGSVLTGDSAPTEGMETYLRDVDRLETYDGSAWKTLSEWQTTNPTWSSSLGSVSIGNGTKYWRWTKIGKTVHARMLWVAGNTTTFGTFGTPPSAGMWSFSLPVPAASDTIGEYATGSALAWRPNVAWYQGMPLLNPSLGTIKFAGDQVGYTWGRWDDGPFSGGPQAADQISVSITYEAAS